jgi:hypothetical protein
MAQDGPLPLPNHLFLANVAQVDRPFPTFPTFLVQGTAEEQLGEGTTEGTAERE